MIGFKQNAIVWALALLCCACATTTVSDLPSTALAFRYERLDGELDTIGRHRGKVVLISVFATWAGPALLEVPMYKRLAAEHGSDQFVIIQLALDQEIEAVHAFVETFEVQHLVGRPDDLASFTGEAGPLGPIGVLPTSYLVDRDGRITARSIGTWDAAVLERAVQGLLAADRSSH